MLFIVFKAGDASYALEARQVIEVVPLVTLRACPGAPAYMTGLANYHGTGVPIVDLGRLVGGAPCAVYLSTRIILTTYAGGDGQQRVIGLLAETVIETVEREEADFSQTGVAASGTSDLGKLAVSGTGFVQRVVVEQLVPKELEKILFAEPEKAAS
ncbi:MAG: chemotaxis protein CheW [Kiritimatiellae bacterium]|nr:chemotaxis protein CheW [Verrucomicrobiota bacterium]MBU4365582.1 chemotaxis protein CheW [Verrucomicrobiota bacterium]MCG2660258.1 chemotaxis protein CheW [Kiritimatiellia bacterium]